MKENNLFYLVYSLVFYLYKFIIRAIRPEIKFLWYRNSFKLGYWSFLRSDIDITILIEKKNIKSIKHIYKAHSYFRKYIKIIGEVSIYTIEDLDIISSIINPIELSRDPNLVKFLCLGPIESTSNAEKLIFASKYLISNDKAPDKFNTRTQKKNYLEQTLLIKIDSLADIKNFIIGQDMQDGSSLELYLHNKLPTKPLYSQIDAVFFNKLIHHPDTISSEHFTDENLKILIDLIKWEIWGCYAHNYLTDKKTIKNYIEKLLNSSMNHKIKTEINELKQKAKQLNMI